VKPSGLDGFEVIDCETGPVKEANEFLRAVTLRGLARLTLRAYAFDLAIIYRWLAATGKTVRELKAADLLDLIEVHREGRINPNTINRRLTTIRLLYRFCTDHDLSDPPITRAPYYRGRGRDKVLGLHNVGKPHKLKLYVNAPRTLVEPLTADEIRHFLRQLRRYRDLAIVHLLLFAGLRSMEVLNVTLDDLQLDEQRLRVRGKGNRERMVPLADRVVSLIRDYLRFERPSASPTDRLFVLLHGRRSRRPGHPMTPAGLRSLFRCRRRDPILAKANPHRFRHTFGADMARAGVRLPILQRLMGHRDLSTTLKYINLSMEDVAAEYQRASAEIRKRYKTDDTVVPR
jgi:site-specific recombinase XerD